MHKSVSRFDINRALSGNPLHMCNPTKTTLTNLALHIPAPMRHLTLDHLLSNHIIVQHPIPYSGGVNLLCLATTTSAPVVSRPASLPILMPAARNSQIRLYRWSGFSSPQRGQAHMGVQQGRPWVCGMLAGPRGWAAVKSGQVRRLRSGAQRR